MSYSLKKDASELLDFVFLIFLMLGLYLPTSYFKASCSNLRERSATVGMS